MSYLLLLCLAILMVVDYRQTVVGIWAYKCVETQPVPKAMISRFGVSGLVYYQAAWFVIVSIVVFVYPSQWAAPLIPIVATSSAVLQNASVIRERRNGWGRYTYAFARSAAITAGAQRAET